MALLRTTVSGLAGKNLSRTPGTQIGLRINTFGLDKLQGITGADLAPILLEAIQPAYEQALAEWPIITGASRDTIDTAIQEEATKLARVVLQVGGQRLIDDPRNKSHKDYAPFVEFNRWVLTHAIYNNLDAIKENIRQGVGNLIKQRLG